MSTCLVITGASGELGRIVLRAALADSEIDQVVATSYRQSIPEQSEKLTSLTGLDLCDDQGIQRLADVIERIGARKVGLVHCAGGFPTAAALHRTSMQEVTATFAANVITFLGAAQAVLPHMRRRGLGHLVAFTSHTQNASYPFLGSFNLSKVALLSAVQTLANENARYGVSVNAIAVATLQTETERQIKPRGVYNDWVPVDGLASYAISLIKVEQAQLNGSELHYWRYSRSFFESSVFERNSFDSEILDESNE